MYMSVCIGRIVGGGRRAVFAATHNPRRVPFLSGRRLFARGANVINIRTLTCNNHRLTTDSRSLAIRPFFIRPFLSRSLSVHRRSARHYIILCAYIK